MKKLNFENLKEKADSVISSELLSSINGGVENSCHIVTDKDGDIIIYGPVQGTIIIH